MRGLSTHTASTVSGGGARWTRRATTAFREDWWRAPVGVAMVPSPQTAHPDDSLTEAAARLANARIGALPIVELGALVGIVTVSDVLDAEVRTAMA